jgi:hypothetical protein
MNDKRLSKLALKMSDQTQPKDVVASNAMPPESLAAFFLKF